MFIIVNKVVKYSITGVFLGFFEYLCSTKKVKHHTYTKVVNVKHITIMKTNDFMSALNEARRESVKSELSNKDSKLAKLYAAKVAANDAYNKGEREHLFLIVIY